MKKFIPVLVAAIASLIIVVVVPLFTNSLAQESAYRGQEASLISQEIIEILDVPTEIVRVYDEGVFVGVLQSERKLENRLNRIYNEEYKAQFPNSSLGLGEEIYLVHEVSYVRYEDKDEEIINHLQQQKSVAIETNAIEFSNKEGIYEILYVDDIQKYEDALDQYMLYFVNDRDFQLLKSNQTVPELSTYGTRDKSIQIYQGVNITRGYANPSEIKTTVEEVLEYLRYGDGVEKEYYTVKPYDMLDGVATKVGRGLSAQQLVNINDDILQSVDQILVPGTELSITYFESPIDVEVVKEAIVREEIYITDPLLIEDATMYQGDSEIIQESEPGYENVMYEEVWINGQLVRGERVSSVVTKQPQQEIIRVGSKEIPKIGTGNFRIPIDNSILTCAWGCYPGHRAIDFQNAYNRYGNIYASDRGVVKVASYGSINGYYMIIDHGNGFETYYGHMNTAPYFEEGDLVNKGDVIGQIGMTGVASGPHVHFFILYNGDRKNPCDGFMSC